MHALILAAGRGERMRPLTDKTPKPLLYAGRLRLIEHQINALALAHITDLVINHAHLGSQIVSALGNGAKYGVRITYSEEPEGALETGGGIRKAIPLLKTDPFMVINGDIWTNYPFSRLSKQITGLAHIVLVENPEHNPRGDFLFRDDHVFELGKDAQGRALTFSGIGVYRHALFQSLPPGRFPLAPILIKAMAKQKVTGEFFEGNWIDIGTSDRLAELNKQLSDNKMSQYGSKP